MSKIGLIIMLHSPESFWDNFSVGIISIPIGKKFDKLKFLKRINFKFAYGWLNNHQSFPGFDPSDGKTKIKINAKIKIIAPKLKEK